MNERRSQEGHIHVMPVGDLREHESSSQCFCKPTEDEDMPGLWVHHALDGREQYETGEMKPQ